MTNPAIGCPLNGLDTYPLTGRDGKSPIINSMGPGSLEPGHPSQRSGAPRDIDHLESRGAGDGDGAVVLVLV